MGDQVMMNALDKVVNDEDISCKECNDTVVSVHTIVFHEHDNDIQYNTSSFSEHYPEKIGFANYD